MVVHVPSIWPTPGKNVRVRIWPTPAYSGRSRSKLRMRVKKVLFLQQNFYIGAVSIRDGERFGGPQRANPSRGRLV